jgi:RimJ/RimL family protein N-acetyltransferase
MMHRILDPVSQGGMGYRRCQWTTTTRNEKSQVAAKRLGYTHEGVLRGFKILPPGKEACRGTCMSSHRGERTGVMCYS